MVKIKYIGDMSPVRIDVKGSVLNWTRGEEKDVNKELAEGLLLNAKFAEVALSNKPVTKKKEYKYSEEKEEDE